MTKKSPASENGVEALINLIFSQIDKRLDEESARNVERFTSAKEAVTKAETATEIRFQGVNEFRQTLTDQNRDFVRTVEYNAQYKSLVDKVDAISITIATIDNTVRNRLSSTVSGPAFIGSILSVMVVIIISGIGVAISLGSLQTHVQINTDELSKIRSAEEARLLEHAGENVERGNFQTRQQLDEQRIGRMEDDNREKAPTLNGIIERLTKLETAAEHK
jgi:hypothetical protein